MSFALTVHVTVSGKKTVSKICVCFVEDATCTDDLQNGKETDVDCGGSDCYKCQDNKKCHVNEDCLSKLCSNGICSGNL